MSFDPAHILHECQFNPSLVLGIKTNVGAGSVQRGLSRISTQIPTLTEKANHVLLIRDYLSKEPTAEAMLEAAFTDIYSAEDIFEDSQDGWKEKTSEQIFFEKDSNFAFLNQIPGIVALLVFLKVWLAPIFAVLSPILIVILPFLMIKYVYKMDIPWFRYQGMLLQMLLGSDNTAALFSINGIGKILYFIISLSQTIIQPFLTALAVNRLDILVREKGHKIQKCIHAGQRILDIYKAAGFDKVPEIPYEDWSVLNAGPHSLFAKDKDEGWTTKYLGIILGDCEVMFRLAQDKRFRAPVWLDKNSENLLSLSNFYDISLKNPKKSSVVFSSKTGHACLTGPNRGGKSSSLRGILQNILWAQTYGLVPCDRYEGRIFSWIVSSLRAEDRPGESSLFEREVEIAVDILKKAQSSHLGVGLVLIDELFHSTNPPDGEKSAHIFLSRLWPNRNLVSCISTHVYSLVEEADDSIQKLCCLAKINEKDNSIEYTYTLQPGICKVSSVDEVLRENGLRG
jgi:hypothetical protein